MSHIIGIPCQSVGLAPVMRALVLMGVRLWIIELAVIIWGYDIKGVGSHYEQLLYIIDFTFQSLHIYLTCHLHITFAANATDQMLLTSYFPYVSLTSHLIHMSLTSHLLYLSLMSHLLNVLLTSHLRHVIYLTCH